MRARHRGLSCLGALAVALACRPAGHGDEAASGDEDSATAGESGSVPEPAFLNPAVGEFPVDSTKHVPEDIVVQRITLGNTQLLIDGQSVGTLGPGSLLGELTGDRLQLFLRGALTLGAHTLQLASTDAAGPRFSAELTMVIRQPPDALPGFRAALAPDLLGPGDALLTAGAGPRALLAVLVAGKAPALRIHLAEGTSWSATGVSTSLPGHVPDPMAFGPDVAAAALPGETGPVAAVRVAWRRGLPGDAVLTRDVALADPEAAAPELALDLSAPLFADAEYAALGRPILAGDMLLAEFLAPGDVETPLPGDRGLALLRRTAGGWSAPKRVATPAPLDLDATGPALDLVDPTADPPALSVRAAGRLSALLQFSPAGAPLLSYPQGERELPPGDPAVLTTLVSDFGSRTVAAAVRGRRPVVFFLGTTGQLMSVAAEPAADTLPALALAAPPAAAVVRGYSTFLLPYGDDAPAHLLVGDGAQVHAIALTDPEPLHCRAVALLTTLAGNDDGGAVPLACLTSDGLRLGVLTADPPPAP